MTLVPAGASTKKRTRDLSASTTPRLTDSPRWTICWLIRVMWKTSIPTGLIFAGESCRSRVSFLAIPWGSCRLRGDINRTRTVAFAIFTTSIRIAPSISIASHFLQDRTNMQPIRWCWPRSPLQRRPARGSKQTRPPGDGRPGRESKPSRPAPVRDAWRPWRRARLEGIAPIVRTPVEPFDDSAEVQLLAIAEWFQVEEQTISQDRRPDRGSTPAHGHQAEVEEARAHPDQIARLERHRQVREPPRRSPVGLGRVPVAGTLAEDVHVGSTHEAELHVPAPELNGDECQEVLVGRRAIGIRHHPFEIDGVVSSNLS